MRLSLQTVCIIFGVTLAHLLVISALSPVELEMSRPRIALDPELESLLEADAGHLAEDPPAETIGTPVHPLGSAENTVAPAPPVPPAGQSATRPAPNLAGNDEAAHPEPTQDAPAAVRPATAVREIRSIAPAPRS